MGGRAPNVWGSLGIAVWVWMLVLYEHDKRNSWKDVTRTGAGVYNSFGVLESSISTFHRDG
jgi:hypothetical protein